MVKNSLRWQALVVAIAMVATTYLPFNRLLAEENSTVKPKLQLQDDSITASLHADGMQGGRVQPASEDRSASPAAGQNAAQTPNQNPGQPGQTPGQPAPNPGQPGQTPGQPGQTPGQPGQTPGEPGQNPGQPQDNDDQGKEEDEEEINTEKEAPEVYLNRHLPKNARIIPGDDPETVEEANKQLEEPPVGPTYSYTMNFKAYRLDKIQPFYQPYRITVGEHDSNPPVSYRFVFPDLQGYKKPQEDLQMDYNFIKAKNNKTEDFIYTSGKQKVKIKHTFQSLNDKEKFLEDDTKTTYTEGNIGAEITVPYLPEDQRIGFAPENVELKVTVPENTTDFFVEVRYKRAAFDVVYDSVGGSGVPARRLYFGQTIPPIAKNPEKKGSTLKGWRCDSDIYELDESGKIKVDQASGQPKKLYTAGDLIPDLTKVEYANAMPAKKITFTAEWQEATKADYTLQFWIEKPDHDPNPAKWQDNYLYAGAKLIKGGLVGTVPLYRNFDNERGQIQFPGIDPEDLQDKDKFKRYYYLSEDMFKVANLNQAQEVKTIDSSGNTVYNVIYNRREYTLVFEQRYTLNGEETIQPTFRKNGVEYDCVNKRYKVKARFGQFLRSLWPLDSELTNWEHDTDGKWDDYMSLGWTINMKTGEREYRDMPHYRLTKKFIGPKTAEFLRHSSVPGVNEQYDEYTISFGLDVSNQSGKVGPVHMVFYKQSLADAVAGNDNKDDFVSDLDMYYVKSDTFSEDYNYTPPELQGFTIVSSEETLKLDKLDEGDLDELKGDPDDPDVVPELPPNAEFKIHFLGCKETEYDENGILKMHYLRNKHSLKMCSDPAKYNDNAFSQSVEVYYDQPLAALDLDHKYKPQRPAGIPNNYEFFGWAYDTKGVKMVKDSNEKMIDYDMYIYAIWRDPHIWEMTFDPNGGTLQEIDPNSLYECQKDDICLSVQKLPHAAPTDKQIFKVPDGTTIKDPNFVPQRDGYTFLGWEHVRYDANGDEDKTFVKKYTVPELYAFGNQVFEKSTLRAIWLSNNFYDIWYLHHYFDKMGKEIEVKKNHRKVGREGSYVAAVASQDENYILRTDKKFLAELKDPGKNKYFQTLKVVKPKASDKPGEGANVFNFYYRPFRHRVYYADHLSQDEDGQEYAIYNPEKIVNENRDYDVHNYVHINGYKLTSQAQLNVHFNLDKYDRFIGINNTGKKHINYRYDDYRVIRRQSESAATPKGYHRVVVKLTEDERFNDDYPYSKEDNRRKYIVDVVDGFKDENIPLPEIVPVRKIKVEKIWRNQDGLNLLTGLAYDTQLELQKKAEEEAKKKQEQEAENGGVGADGGATGKGAGNGTVGGSNGTPAGAGTTTGNGNTPQNPANPATPATPADPANPAAPKPLTTPDKLAKTEVELYRDGELYEPEDTLTVNHLELTPDNKWTDTFIELLRSPSKWKRTKGKYDSLKKEGKFLQGEEEAKKEFNYTVQEKGVKDEIIELNKVLYSVEYDGDMTKGYTVVNTQVPFGEIKVHKVWLDRDGKQVEMKFEGDLNKPGKQGKTDPAKPADPANPVDPATPADPGAQVNPADPNKPATGGTQDNQNKPVNPADPAAPNKPVDPNQPANPVDPADQENPADSNDSAETDPEAEIRRNRNEIQAYLTLNDEAMPYRTAISAAQNWQSKFKKVRLAYKRGDKPYEYGVKEAGENYGMVKFRNKTYTVTYQGNAKDGFEIINKEYVPPLGKPGIVVEPQEEIHHWVVAKTGETAGATAGSASNFAGAYSLMLLVLSYIRKRFN
ncbi:InlB B-repeat-containing protein [Amygdalobacter indicium]|uniref:InlB B-repeat-containing protein n=1 Tax=Amygdalobacter indicium TaxID=3029272 RepID=A0ABY8C8D3_9FIRM|nr:InlB B-repeat-containing protein [Amygdalobacter indicium]WEG35784.1 InlB B-repeat-containing protein [Amygdalobacter indicium]